MKRNLAGTTLGLFWEGLVEAGWLVAVVIVPVVFEVRADTVFEVAKVPVFRSIVLVMVLGWVGSAVERDWGSGGESGSGLGRRFARLVAVPLVLPALGLVAVHVVATVSSVWRHGSFWGSYERRQGLYVTLAYAAFFVLILKRLRSQGQVERLVRLVILASLPVSIYAIGQRFGLDPLDWEGPVVERVASTLGNPIFTAGYLIMVVPLALRQTIYALQADERASVALRLASASFYGTVVTLHLAAIVLTQSRGPMAGLLGGLFFFVLVCAVSASRKALVLLTLSGAMLLVLLIVVLNLPNTPFSPVREWPYAGRLTAIRGDPTLQSRVAMWYGGVEMAAADPLRTLIGYGPESARVAFYPHLTAELADHLGRTQTTGRFHNETIDALVGTGLMGVLAYLALFASIFRWVLHELGLIRDHGDTLVFLGLEGAGAALGLASAWLATRQVGFAAPLVPLGMLIGLVVYLLTVVFRAGSGNLVGERNQMLLTALLAGVVAHFIELQTGIAVTATRTQFWLYAAMVAAIATGVETEEVQVAAPPQGRRRLAKRRGTRRDSPNVICLPGPPSLLAHSLGVGMLLVTIGFSFIVSRLSVDGVVLVAVLWLLVWVLGGISFVALPRVGGAGYQEGAGKISWLLIYTLVALGCLLIYLPLHAVGTSGSGPPTAAATVFILFISIALTGVALGLVRGRESPALVAHPGRWWIHGGLLLVTALLVLRTNLHVVQADVLFGRANIQQAGGRLDESIDLYRRAVELTPRQDHYYPLLGQACLRKAVIAGPTSPWFEEAEGVFARARALSPLRPDHYANLGLLYEHWGRALSDPARAAEKLQLSLSYYERAATMSPHTQGELVKDHRLAVHLRLAEAYRATGRIVEAVAEAEDAKRLASDELESEIDELIRRLEGSPP